MKAYKTELHPTPEQKAFFFKTFGVCRFVYNLFIDTNKKRHESSEKYQSAFDFSKYLNNTYREENPDKAWILEVCSKSVKKAVICADVAYRKFMQGKGGFPKFKSRHNDSQSAYFTQNIIVERHRIKLPKVGWIRTKEFGYLPTTNISSATVSYKAGHFFVSVLTKEEQKEEHKHTDEVIGIDLGIKEFAVCSDRQVFKNINKTPRVRKLVKLLKRKQRSLAKKKKGSSNRWKCRLKVQRAFYKLACIREDYIKKVVSLLVRTKPKAIAIEDLAVSNMMKNRHLARSIQEQLFSYFRTFLAQKCDEYGILLVAIDRFFPSSKTCSHCGAVKKELKLSERTFNCPCGFSMDRDLNAAINICRAGLARINACGLVYQNQVAA